MVLNAYLCFLLCYRWKMRVRGWRREKRCRGTAFVQARSSPARERVAARGRMQRGSACGQAARCERLGHQQPRAAYRSSGPGLLPPDFSECECARHYITEEEDENCGAHRLSGEGYVCR